MAGTFLTGKVNRSLKQCISCALSVEFGQYIYLLQLHLGKSFNLFVERIFFKFYKISVPLIK